MAKITVSCIGCSLMDYLYNGISFTGEQIAPFFSAKEGDGGLLPGKLVFTEELEHFAGKPYPDILARITNGRNPDAMNIGGPGIVPMIHLAQLTGPGNHVRFYGAAGNDRAAGNLKELLSKTPLSGQYLKTFPSSTPFTHVLSDPDYDGGHGERIFINNIGAAAELDFPYPSFFDGDITVFGGTALVPQIHDNLSLLLRHAKENNSFTIVNTVYDFRNQEAAPGTPWPLGHEPGTLRNIDLLIMDREEAVKISGTADSTQAMDYFISGGIRGVIITDGTRPVKAWSGRGAFRSTMREEFPVSEAVIRDLQNTGLKGDTTGCGDNFTGGVIYAIARKLEENSGKPDLADAIAWGIASGGFACFYLGGTYYENRNFEKHEKVKHYYDLYRQS